MNDSKATRRRLSVMSLAAVALALPACHSTGSRTRDAARIAYKPIPTSLRGRAFYVSGYGGADYSRNRPRRDPPVAGVPAYALPAPTADVPAVTVRQWTWDEP